ncbi:MAG: alpha-galactosidase [Clostridia bacterium]|nr:alpha-galactosidase [Clostridia bacterium]
MQHLKLAKTPPMGWNSWDCFGASVRESEVMANADYMAQKLKSYGWEYIIVDIQWYEPNAISDIYNTGAQLEMDEWSRLIPAANRFPSSAGGKGLRPLADYVHSLGLKFGIHILRGIARQAVKLNTPILGTPYRAADIADTSSTCQWNGDMYGVNPNAKGAQEYYNSIFSMYAQWEIDFVKVDDITRPYHSQEAELIRRAIENSGRDIVLSFSPGAAPLSGAKHLCEHANMWRMSDDFWDTWEQLHQMFELCRNWQSLRTEGAWPDCDMLPLGKIGIRSRGGVRNTNFTPDEQRTMMALWCMFRSPLFFGGDMPQNDSETEKLITNRELIWINQHSHGNRELYRDERGIIVWIAKGSDKHYVAQFNTSSIPLCAETPLSLLGISGTKATEVFDGTCAAVGKTLCSEIPPHGVCLWRLE